MKRWKGVWAVCLLWCSTAAWAQYDVEFTNYFALNGFYNPAYAGQKDRLNIYGSFALQLAGFERAPRSMCVGADMAFKGLGMRHGVGAGFFNESLGLLRNQRFWAQYSAKVRLAGGMLGIGLQVGGLSIAFDPKDIDLGEADNAASDPAFPTAEVSGTGLDLGAGLFYTHRYFYAGLSVSHLTAPTVRWGESNEMSVSPTFYFTAAGNIKTKNSLLEIQPSVLLKTDGVAYKVDLTGRVLYTWHGRTYYGGLTYSPGVSVAVLLGAQLKDVSVGYAYNIFTSKIGAVSGSHDIYVNYALDLSFMGKSKNKHKSIRIL